MAQHDVQENCSHNMRTTVNMAQDESTLQENQKDEVAITADEFISSQKADRQIEKQNVASTTESPEPDL